MLPEYFRLAVRREAEYKVGFYTFIVNQTITVGIWLLFWRVLFSRIGELGSWDFPRMVLLTGFVAISFGIWFTFSTIWRLPRLIVTGELNIHLIKPVHPFLHVILGRLNLRSLPRIGIGLTILITGLHYYDISYSWPSLILAGLTSLLSFLAVFLPFAMVCMLAFWVGRAEFARDLFIEIFIFQNYPLSEFPLGFIVFFTFMIPMIFIGTVPVQVLTVWSIGLSLAVLLLLILIVILQLRLFNYVWKRGLRRYESFGG